VCQLRAVSSSPPKKIAKKYPKNKLPMSTCGKINEGKKKLQYAECGFILNFCKKYSSPLNRNMEKKMDKDDEKCFDSA